MASGNPANIVSCSTGTPPTAASGISFGSTNQHEKAVQQNAQQPSAGTARKEPDLPPGYPKLAERMSLIPETAVFRRFGFLNKLNLLYLQAELMDLEDQIKAIQKEDSAKPGCEQYYSKDWFFLGEGDSPQLKLIQASREKLDAYNTALIQQSYILPMKPPGRYDLDYIQKYLASRDMGPWALDGLDAEIWGTVKKPHGHEADIIALLPRPKKDIFSNLVTGKGMAQWFKYGLDRFRQASPVHGLVAYEESTLLRITYLVSTALASVLPIMSIVVLYFVQSMEVRLGIIAIFNVLISLCLAFFTTAKPTDIFAVAAAFSAVQVVFVQGSEDTLA